MISSSACAARLAKSGGVPILLRVFFLAASLTRRAVPDTIHNFLDPERLAAYQDLIRRQLGSDFTVRETKKDHRGA